VSQGIVIHSRIRRTDGLEYVGYEFRGYGGQIRVSTKKLAAFKRRVSEIFSQARRRVDEITLRGVSFLRVGLVGLLCTGSSEDHVYDLGQVAASTCPSLLLAIVVEADNTTEEADVFRCVLP
jgi:hypothetical protein